MADTIALTGIVSTDAIVLNGVTGVQQEIVGVGGVSVRGPKGDQGSPGDTGVGVVSGGTTNQALTKNSDADYDTEWSTIDKTFVGLENIDNTSDVNKPISTATQTALDGKQAIDSDLTAIAGLSPSNDDIIQRKSGAWTNRTIAQYKSDLALTKSDVGLGNVDNTSDANKPVSSATQTALDAKVAGASSSTDNAITRFDSTTGKVVQNSSVTVSDTGLVETPDNFRSNRSSGNPTYQFAESGTNRAQIYYDVTNNRLTLQNQENNADDAIYIPDAITTTGQFTGARIYGTLLDANNTGSTFPEVRLLEGGVVRGKLFYDFDEDQIVIQNQESDADDAVRINDSVLINGVEKKLTISQTVGGDTSQYRLWQDDADLFVIDRIGDTTGDGDNWVLVDLRSPQMLTLEDSEATLSLTTRAGAPGGISRTLDIYNDEYSRDNGMGMRQLYKNTTPNPIRFEEHDKTTNNGAWTMTDVILTEDSPNGSYDSVSGVTPDAEDWIWDNAGVYLPDDTKIVSIDTGAKTFVLNRNATSTGTAASIRGKNIRETMRINEERQLLVRKFIADQSTNVAEFGGDIRVNGNVVASTSNVDHDVAVIMARDLENAEYVQMYHTGTYGQIESTTSLVLAAPNGTVATGTSGSQLQAQYAGGDFSTIGLEHDDTDGTIHTSKGDLVFNPTADVDANSNIIKNVSDGSASGDAVNKGQLDTKETVTAWQTWSPTHTGFSAAPVGGIYRYRTVGDHVEIEVVEPADGTSNASGFTLTLPVTAATVTNMEWVGFANTRNAGAYVNNTSLAVISSAGTTITFYISPNRTTTWGTTGGKRCAYLRMRYRI